MVGAVGKHLALIGFMGAGKSRVGRELARLTHRPFVDTDREIEKRHGPIGELFERGEPEFRLIEEQVVAEALAGPTAVIALGGGAVLSDATRKRLRRSAFVAWVTVDVDTAWSRVRKSGRPLARDREEFGHLFDLRADFYDLLAQGTGQDAESLLLESLHFIFSSEIACDAAVIADERVAQLHELPVVGGAKVTTHVLPAGEGAKTLAVVERLWNEVEIGRDGWIVGFGGGSTTDVAGFTAATYLRGVHWVAVPTTLVGMVDAAIGGKTGINTEQGKNLVGAFHFPYEVRIDPRFLVTLPPEERRAGMAEVVKTGLLAGKPLWELPEEEMIRAAAAFKSAVVLSDPYERQGRRAILNLGHTFAHALEAGSGYALRHGDAVALGLLAALRLSGRPTDVVEEVLAPEPVRVDRGRAWDALLRDKKGALNIVLLGDDGGFVTELPEDDVRRALDELIAD
ncbi:MAG TPA: bifunctional shikimate kinase/3-dehydroquinate synthase [Gaiellaceae bacterium]|nr:bifunctional shikimate kinase/3-dehydroquinate synthase [Gaiellaceae bacterium]